MKKTLSIVVLLVAVAAIVWHREARVQTAPIIPATTPTTLAAPVAIAPANEPDTFCPHIDEILKDPTEGNWTAKTAEGFWKSYNMSFATSLTKFVGAQWVGANLGQLTCVYHSEQEFKMQGQATIQKTLPVLLVFHSLVFQPSGANWVHTSKGVYNCAPSTNGRADCPFKIRVKKTTGDIYEEAESLKESSKQPLQPPSY